MPRYYFDLRDNDELAVDDEGVELFTLQAVQIEAARSLVDMARQAIWTKAETILDHRMAIEVRDEHGPVLQASLNGENSRVVGHRLIGTGQGRLQRRECRGSRLSAPGAARAVGWQHQ
jgi:hypothetical protein